MADESAENVSETLVDPSVVSVVGVVSTDPEAMNSPQTGTKDKSKKKHSTPLKRALQLMQGLRQWIRNGLNVSVVWTRYFCPCLWKSQIPLFKF